MNITSILIVLVLFFSSCNTAGPGVFGKKSFHDQYGNKLTEAGLKETVLGNLWFSAAENALNNPSSITLPYKEIGYFSHDKPSAVGLLFTAKKGEKLIFDLTKKPANGFILFTEIWQVEETNKPSLLQAFDTTINKFDFEIEDAGNYILRIQPELLKSGEYNLSISIGSTLNFPVAGNNAKIGSVWGDERDAGARRHEGIDIFAAKRTPAVAAYDGVISRVNENNLGGKTVWLRPKGKNYTLYYAHLDEQLVSDGQKVEKGDTVGLVGNTGNAITTSPHLHFGIYAPGGAIDPLPFVDPKIKIASNVTTASDAFKNWARLKTNHKVKTTNNEFSFKQYTLVKPLAASSKDYRVEMPDGSILQIPITVIELAKIIKQVKIINDTFLHESPSIESPRKKLLKSSAQVEIKAYYNNYAFVSYNDVEGWLPIAAIN